MLGIWHHYFFRSSRIHNNMDNSKSINSMVKWLIVIIGLPLVYLFITRQVVLYAVVEGNSMEPTYHTADRVTMTRVPLWFHGPRVGEVVLIREFKEFGRGDGKIDIKRVKAITNNTYYVRGDNTNNGASFDSCCYGSLPANQIFAVEWK